MKIFLYGDYLNLEILLKMRLKIELLANNYAEKQLDLIKYTIISRLIIVIVAMFLCVLFLNLSVNYFSFDFEKLLYFVLYLLD